MNLRKIVVATDFSPPARNAARRAGRLAAEHQAEVVLLHAFNPGRPGASIHDPMVAEQVAAARSAIESLLEKERAELAAAGVRSRVLRVDGPPAEVLPGAARTEAADLLVVAPRGRTALRRVLLGSIAEKVMRASDVPVLIARGEPERGFEKILVGTDFGDSAERALAAAVAIAPPGATIEVVHFVSIGPLVAVPMRALAEDEMLKMQGNAYLAASQLVARHRRDDVQATSAIHVGDARDGLLRLIDDGGHDLVVVGRHGRGALARAVLGSVSEAVARHAPCSVLVVR